MFEKELAFFIKNQTELVASFGGKALIICGEKIEGVHDTPLAAYIAAQKQFKSGTFMIQPCEPGVTAYSVTINSIN